MGIFDSILGKKRKEEEARLERERQEKLKKEQEEKARLERKKQEELKREREENARKERVSNAIQQGKPVKLLVFHTTWCGPSKRLLQDFGKAGLKYSVIDVEKEKDLGEKYRIRNVPTTILVDEKGEILNKWIGYDDEDPGQTKIVEYLRQFGNQIIDNDGSSLNAPHQVSLPSSIEEDNRTTFFQLGNIRLRKMGPELCVAPYDSFWLEQAPDAEVLPLIANTPEIKKYLPGLNFSDAEQSKKALQGYIFQTEKQISVTYVIRQSNFPIGMVYVHTPKYNMNVMGLKIWTIDFFIASMCEHKGIMKQSLFRVMEQMKSAMGVSKAYALTEPDNNSCINLLRKVHFQEIDNKGFKNPQNPQKNPLVFMIDLSKINFVQ